MSDLKYIIPELSAQSILATAREVEGGYRFYLDATDPSREYLVEYTQQDDCPMFYQAMLVLGKRAESGGVSDALRDAFVYVDFSGIFNRGGTLRILQQQKMAEHLFRPEGITLNFGGVDRRYVAFERSASMSRNNRLPYIKGVVHKVDFAALFAQLQVPYILDLWGSRHNPADIDLILTESMFKGLGWMRENGLSWEQYLARCRKYNHALYVSGVDKLEAQSTTELNYQFLNTLSITDEEFRPKDLPLGWQTSPEEDPRHWLTKTTELEYYRLIADPEARQQHFANAAQNTYATIARDHRSKLIEKNAYSSRTRSRINGSSPHSTYTGEAKIGRLGIFKSRKVLCRTLMVRQMP